MSRDLREFMRKMEQVDGKWCLNINQPIKPDKFEVSALAHKLGAFGNPKALLFNNVSNLLGEKSDIKLLVNAFAQRSANAVAMGLKPEQYGMDLTRKIAQCTKEHGSMQVIPQSDAPAQEVVLTGDQVDVRRFPVPMLHEKDVGPFFTMVNLMKSRTEDFYEMGMVKNQIYGPKSISSSANLRFYKRDMARLIKDYEEAKVPAPIVLVLGHDPAFTLGSQAGVPFGNNDYLTVSSFMGQPVRVTPSVTWGKDFLVPADAEILIECELIPGARENQNPFGEFSGHYQAQRKVPVLEVKAITHRKDAILQAIYSGSDEHANIGSLPREGNLFGKVQSTVSGVRAIHLPPWGKSHFACVFSLDKGSSSDVQKAAMSIFSILEDCKLVIAVDSEVDVYNSNEVWYVIATQCRIENDGITIMPNVQSFRSWLGTSGAVIDATKPDDPDFPERMRIPQDVLDRINYIP